MPERFGLYKAASESFARPSGTTQYAVGDSVAPASKSITGATNATPIVLTITAHGYATGDYITIASVGGNTNANGDRKVVKIDADTFSITDTSDVAIAGNSAYTSGGTATRLLRLANVVRYPGGQGRICRTRLVCNSATLTDGVFRVHFFTAPVIQIVDNAAWTLLYANRAKLTASSGDLTMTTEGAGSDGSQAQDLSVIPFKCAAGSQDLFVVITAEDTYTPTSAETFYLEVMVDQY